MVRLKILYHHRTLGHGAEGIHVREMVRALRDLGHDVRVEALVGEHADPEKSRQGAWTQLSRFIPEPVYEVAEVAYNLVSSRTLSRAIAEFRPDFVYDRYNSYSSAAVNAARRAGLPVILEVNAPVVFERSHYENLRLRLPWLAKRYERKIFASATRLLTVSTPLKSFISETHAIDPQRITILPNGVDPSKFEPGKDPRVARRELSLPEGLMLGFVGAARPWHGLELLVHAFASLANQHPQAYLLLVGGGPSTHEIRTLVSSLGLTARVLFVDHVDYERVPHYLCAMDVAVSPRATFYASPLKLVEYMAMAKAIVAPAMPNITDLVRDQESALLFQPENVASLGAALDRLLSDAALRVRLGLRARHEVEQKHNWRAKALEVLNIYASLRAPQRSAADRFN